MLTLCSNCMRQREEGRVETQSCFIAKAPTQHQRWRALSWQKLEKPPFLGNSESTTTSGQRQYCEQSPGTVRLLCSLRRDMLPGVTGKEEMPAAFIHFPCVASLHTSFTDSRQTGKAVFRGVAEETQYLLSSNVSSLLLKWLS